jgi:hypothetical protein
MYREGEMEGPWLFFNALGHLDYKLTYVNGSAQEREFLDKQQEERFRIFEENRGRLRDPEEYSASPEEYFLGR